MVYRRNLRKRKTGFFSRLGLNNLLIAINIIIFIIFMPLLFFLSADEVIKYVAINPELFFQGFVWTLVTSMFMHGSFAHLFVNMVSLFFIGSLTERLIGRKRYLWFYLISGIAGGLFFVLFAYAGLFLPFGENLFGGFDAFAVGASGALFGLGGLLAVLIPRLKVLVFFVLPMPMWLAMAVLMFGLWAISVASALPVGNTAHLGGLVIGVVYGFYLRKKYSRKVRMLNRMIR